MFSPSSKECLSQVTFEAKASTDFLAIEDLQHRYFERRHPIRPFQARSLHIMYRNMTPVY